MNLFKILVISFITAFAFSAIGQDFNGGVLGGINATQVFGDQWSGPNKAGLYVGAFVNRYFSKRSSIQLELDYIQKGSSKNPDPSTGDYDEYKLKLNYIELPVLYKYDFAPRGTLETGLSLGVLIKQDEYAYPPPTSGKEFNTIDFSFNLGAYYSFAEYWRINIRLAHSIIPIRPHASGQTYRLNKGQYNQSIAFILHYVIPGLSR
jgi:hypothetical protein